MSSTKAKDSDQGFFVVPTQFTIPVREAKPERKHEYMSFYQPSLWSFMPRKTEVTVSPGLSFAKRARVLGYKVAHSRHASLCDGRGCTAMMLRQISRGRISMREISV
jgi:hypothetical protein